MSILYKNFFSGDCSYLLTKLTTPILEKNSNISCLYFPGLKKYVDNSSSTSSSTNSTDTESNHVEKKQKTIITNQEKEFETKTISSDLNIQPGLLKDIMNDYDQNQDIELIEDDTNHHSTNHNLNSNHNSIMLLDTTHLRVKPILDICKNSSDLELQKYLQSEDSKRNPTFITLTQELFQDISNPPEHHISYGNIGLTHTLSLSKGLPILENLEYPYVREMAVSCGYITTMNNDSCSIYIPGCSKDNRCCGYSGMIEGLLPELKGIRFRCFMSPSEWKLLQSGKIMNYNNTVIEDVTQEKINKKFGSRRCLLDKLIAQYKLAIEIGIDSDRIQIPETEFYQLGIFLIDEENGYKSEFMHKPKKDRYEGILNPYPIINFSNMPFYYRHDVNLWALDMRNIEYNPTSLLGYYPTKESTNYFDRPWSIEEQILKSQQQFEYDPTESNLHIPQIIQMTGQNTILNDQQKLIQSFIQSDIHYNNSTNNNIFKTNLLNKKNNTYGESSSSQSQSPDYYFH